MNLPSSRLSEMDDAADSTAAEGYRPVSRLAIVALLMGLCSPLAAVGHVLLYIPAAVAVAASLAAMLQLRREAGRLAGWGAARWGLALALGFSAFALARDFSHRWLARQEARTFADQWFAALLADKPALAHQMEQPVESRQPSEESLLALYRNSTKARESLAAFAKDPVVRALLAIGKEGVVRYWGTEDYSRTEKEEVVTQAYAVTYGPENDRTTFFVRLIMQRTPAAGNRPAYWRVYNYIGGVRPFVARDRPH